MKDFIEIQNTCIKLSLIRSFELNKEQKILYIYYFVRNDYDYDSTIDEHFFEYEKLDDLIKDYNRLKVVL